MVAGSRKAQGLKKEKLARDDHARVPLGIPTALFPIPRGSDPIRSLLKARFALYKGHFAGNHLWESLGRSNDRRIQPDSREPTQNPKTGPGTEKIESKSFSQEAFDAT